NLDLANGRMVDDGAVLLGHTGRERRELLVQRLCAERCREDEDFEFLRRDRMSHGTPRRFVSQLEPIVLRSLEYSLCHSDEGITDLGRRGASPGGTAARSSKRTFLRCRGDGLSFESRTLL